MSAAASNTPVDPDSDDVRSAPLPSDPESRAVKLEPFNKSEALSLGVELELQLVNTHDYDLAPYAEDMLRLMAQTPLPGSVVPEMTSSMIEISTDICHSAQDVITQVALPSILLMEVVGAMLATVAIHAVGESSVPWMPQAFSITEDTQR